MRKLKAVSLAVSPQLLLAGPAIANPGHGGGPPAWSHAGGHHGGSGGNAGWPPAWSHGGGGDAGGSGRGAYAGGGAPGHHAHQSMVAGGSCGHPGAGAPGSAGGAFSSPAVLLPVPAGMSGSPAGVALVRAMAAIHEKMMRHFVDSAAAKSTAFSDLSRLLSRSPKAAPDPNRCDRGLGNVPTGKDNKALFPNPHFAELCRGGVAPPPKRPPGLPPGPPPDVPRGPKHPHPDPDRCDRGLGNGDKPVHDRKDLFPNPHFAYCGPLGDQPPEPPGDSPPPVPPGDLPPPAPPGGGSPPGDLPPPAPPGGGSPPGDLPPPAPPGGGSPPGDLPPPAPPGGGSPPGDLPPPAPPGGGFPPGDLPPPAPPGGGSPPGDLPPPAPPGGTLPPGGSPIGIVPPATGPPLGVPTDVTRRQPESAAAPARISELAAGATVISTQHCSGFTLRDHPETFLQAAMGTTFQVTPGAQVVLESGQMLVGTARSELTVKAELANVTLKPKSVALIESDDLKPLRITVLNAADPEGVVVQVGEKVFRIAKPGQEIIAAELGMPKEDVSRPDALKQEDLQTVHKGDDVVVMTAHVPVDDLIEKNVLLQCRLQRLANLLPIMRQRGESGLAAKKPPVGAGNVPDNRPGARGTNKGKAAAASTTAPVEGRPWLYQRLKETKDCWRCLPDDSPESRKVNC